MRNKINLAVVITAALFWTAACAPGTIPVLVTDIDGFELPSYLPENYGTASARVNPEGLSIKHSYKTSDDVIHIVLTGKIENGIPQGLLWNSIPSGLSPTYPPDAGTFGGTISETYVGQGDYRVGTVSSGDDPATTGSLSVGTGGSYVVALGSPDFSSEWVMAAPYSAVVIKGLISAGATYVNVTETNDSLNLLSQAYRDKTPSPEFSLFRTDRNGRLQKQNNYTYDPNRFKPSEMGQGIPRGGYAFLISKKANPQTAFFEIEYPNGKKSRIEVDYNAVELRGERSNVLKDVVFQSPTPVPNSSQTQYILDGLYDYSLPDHVYAGSIAASPGSIPPEPLYLRPVYTPANIDPSEAATNMIKNIYLTDISGRSLGRGIGDLILLAWDDTAQAITLSINEDSGDFSGYTGGEYTINAVLQNQFSPDNLNYVDKLTCAVTIVVP
jgi:hypothetical protein